MGCYFLMIYRWQGHKQQAMLAPVSKRRLKQAAILPWSVMTALLLTKLRQRHKSYPILTKNASRPCVDRYLFGKVTLSQHASSLIIGNKQKTMSYRLFFRFKQKRKRF